MQNIQYIKEQNVVLVPIEQWEKLQKELARLKKRVKKAEILTDLKDALFELKSDLRDGEYDGNTELSAHAFLAQLEDEQ
jgi:hypothetical protein